MMFLGIYTSPPSSGGTLLLDATYRASGVSFNTGEHGDESMSAFVRLPQHEAFRIFDAGSVLHVVVADVYGRTRFEGRLEDVTIQAGGIQIVAYGYWRALSDIPYNALWSVSKYDQFFVFTTQQIAGVIPDRFDFRNEDHILITPTKNSVQGTTAGDAMIGYTVVTGNGSSRTIVGVSFDFTFVAPAANWRAALQSRDATYGAIANDWLITAAGAGTTTGSINVTIANASIVNFFMDFSAANATYTSETGDGYLKITNLRIVTTTTNRINTTLTANRNAGTSVTATVGSTARMYVGQRLQIGGTVSESVLVESITSGTQFIATFAQNHVTTNTVQAHVVYPDEIVSALVTHISGINSTQLSSSTASIQSPAIDLLDEMYEDELPSDIMTRLASLGDNQSPPRRWSVGAKGQSLYYQYLGYESRTWYVDVGDIQVEKTLDNLYNSVYAKYQTADNKTTRTSSNTDTYSSAKYGITRRLGIDTQTTSATQAGIQRDMMLADKKDPPAKASIKFSAIYDVQGVRYPLWMPRADDEIVIRNLSPETSTNIDRIRRFRISSTQYDADSRTLTVEPEQPRDTLEFMLTRQEKGIF